MHSYRMVLHLRTRAPLAHGAGNVGNEQLLSTEERRIDHPDGSVEWVAVPCVSGAAVKATLREHAVEYYLRALGIEANSMDKDPLRLLLKGGKVTSGSSSVSLDDMREMKRLFPPLAVFGYMDGNQTVRGLVEVTKAMPLCEELVPHQRHLYDFVEEGDGRLMNRALIPLADVWGKPEQRYSHDLSGSRVGQAYLSGATVAQIEEQRDDRGKTAVAKKEQRREACESMPYSFQVIRPDTDLVLELRLTNADHIAFACLGLAIASWRAAGGHLGGVRREGFGACKVRMARCVRLHNGGPVDVQADMTTLPIRVEDASPEAAAEAYNAHLASVAEEARRVMGVS